MGDFADRVQDSHNADIKISSELLQCFVTYNLNKTVCKRHNKGRKAKSTDAQNAGEDVYKRQPQDDYISVERMREIVEEAKNEMKYVNDMLDDGDDEDE